jgi:hypothetical protein
VLFRESPEWIQQVLRQLSRDGYIYIGRTGVGLSYAFRRACYNQGTIKAIEETAQFHDLGYRILLELIATEGPKWVGYERIAEYIENQAILRALKEELT